MKKRRIRTSWQESSSSWWATSQKPHPGPAVISEPVFAVPCEPFEIPELQIHDDIRTVIYANGDACTEDRFIMDMNAHWKVHTSFVRYELILVYGEHIGDGRDGERFHFKHQEKT